MSDIARLVHVAINGGLTCLNAQYNVASKLGGIKVELYTSQVAENVLRKSYLAKDKSPSISLLRQHLLFQLAWTGAHRPSHPP